MSNELKAGMQVVSITGKSMMIVEVLPVFPGNSAPVCICSASWLPEGKTMAVSALNLVCK